MIQQSAEYVIETRSTDVDLQAPQKIKTPKQLMKRLTLTRHVSRIIFERQNSKPELKDGCTPILILDIDEVNNELQEAAARQ